MTARRPAPDQRDRDRAIRARDVNVVADAGAGTGKTTLLVARLVSLVAPEDDGPALELPRVAAITFTRKAAGELKLRIREALLRELARADLSERRRARLAAALGALDTAHVGTIHSFADRLLRLRPVEARLSPSYDIVEDDGELVAEAFTVFLQAVEAGTLADTLGEAVPREVAEALGLGQDELPVLVGTLGKAFGTFGAFVAGSDSLIDYLINSARSYIFTTALPPAVAAATRESVRIVTDGQDLRARLQGNIAHFRHEALRLGLDLMASDTPIQPVILGGNARALAWSASLQERGLLVGAIRPPTVPTGTARLRVTLTAGHSRDDVDRLLDGLAGCARDIG